MDSISYSKARATLAETMHRVCEHHEPTIITRSGQPSVVVISLEDYKAMEETAYLLRSPRNARILMDSISELESGQGQEKGIAL